MVTKFMTVIVWVGLLRGCKIMRKAIYHLQAVISSLTPTTEFTTDTLRVIAAGVGWLQDNAARPMFHLQDNKNINQGISSRQ